MTLTRPSHRPAGGSVPYSRRIYYMLKPAIPRALQLFFRRRIVQSKLCRYIQIWPIDERAGDAPAGWADWPDNKQFALVLNHDVETQAGHDRCRLLMDLEERLGFRSTFNFVAERYRVSRTLRDEIKRRGFGLGVHGLKHDGKLFVSRSIFQKRATQLNVYLEQWETRGFTAPSMLRNLAWMHDLNIDYSTSTFDTDPFEPQPDPIRTIFPVWISSSDGVNGYVELPYTLPQDHLLFLMLKETSIDIWRRKLAWICRKGGMALVNTHPDYMNFGTRRHRESYPSNYYRAFLEHLASDYRGQYFHATASQVAAFWKQYTFVIQAN